MRNSVVLPAPFGPITPTMPPGGSLKVRSSISRLSPKPFLRSSKSMTFWPSRSATGMTICAVCVCFSAALREQVLVALVARLGFGLPRPRRGRDPFLLARERALARLFLAAFLLQPLLLLHEPGRIVALVGNAAAAVELEDPAGDVVEEVAVVGDDQDRARIVAQMAFEPAHRSRRRDGWSARRAAAGRAARAAAGTAPRGAARRPRACRRRRRPAGSAARPSPGRPGNRGPTGSWLSISSCSLRHLVGGLVGVVGGDLVVAVEQRLLGGDALHDVLAHGLVAIELRLLRQVADARALGDPGLADEFRVDAGHDAQQRRLAGAVDAEHADLGVRIERQVDVLQDLAVARIGLGQTLHVIDELTGHDRPALACRLAPRAKSTQAA